MSATEKMHPIDGENNPAEASAAVDTVENGTDESGIAPEKPNENGKKRRTNLNNLWPKIICVLAAVLVWFYVSGDKSINYEKEFYSIPVSFDSLETVINRNMGIVSGADSVVNVTVSGTRSDVNRIKVDDLRASCDLSEVTEPGQYSIPILCDSPGGTAVISVIPSTVTVYVDESIEKSVPVEARLVKGGTVNLNYRIDKLEPAVDTVTITGPKEEIDKIEKAVVDVSLDTAIEQSTKWMGNVYLVDRDGHRYSNHYIGIDRESINITVHVNKYESVPITVKYKNDDAGELGYDVIVTPGNVEIKGSKSIVEAVETVYTKPVDISNIRGITAFSVGLDLPEGVELTDDQSSSVTVSITPNDSKNTIVTPNIVMINVPKGCTAVPKVPSLTVEFYGITESLSKLSPENVYAVADLSGCDGQGDYKVALEVYYPEIKGIRLYDDVTYTAEITIS